MLHEISILVQLLHFLNTLSIYFLNALHLVSEPCVFGIGHHVCKHEMPLLYTMCMASKIYLFFYLLHFITGIHR